MPEPIQMTALTPPERSRTYVFPKGERLTFPHVSKLCVRESGSHRLEYRDGMKAIVAPGWLAIEIMADDWTF